MVGSPAATARILTSGVILFIAIMVGERCLAGSVLEVKKPQNINDVEGTIRDITDDLDRAECGGWSFEESVEGKIPEVTGAPGRHGVVFEDGQVREEVLESGMALRDEEAGAKEDGFLFPGAGYASGWSTACYVNECDTSFPYKQDLPDGPPCRNPEDCERVCLELNLWQKRHMNCVAQWTETVWEGTDEDGNDIYVDYYYEDWLEGTSPCYNVLSGDSCFPDDAWTPIDQLLWDQHPGAFVTCNPEDAELAVDEMLYCCTDARVEDEGSDPTRNCIPCQGDGLAYPPGSDQDYNNEFIPDLYQTGCRKGKEAYPGNGREYFSFFRKYLVSYSRNKVRAVSSDDASRTNIPVLCYGHYDERQEFDPKVQRTKETDRHCVIDLSNPSKRFDAMRQTQAGKGKYGLPIHFPDPPFNSVERDTIDDLWITDMGAAFSLLNGKTLEEKFGRDIPFSLLALDSADQRATVQMSSEIPLSDGNLIRTTDDSVSNDLQGRRPLTEWWQELETSFHAFFTPPVVRLILPTPWSVGLDLSDPLLTPPSSSSSQGNADPHLQAIDIQLNSDREDLLGEVLSYLENALLLHVEEDPVPLVVPFSSPIELRALAQGWKSWGEHQPEGREQANTIAEKLESYAKRIDDVRALRGELAQYIGQVLRYQREMSSAIAEWLRRNADLFDEYMAAWDTRLELKPQWENIQQNFRTFHDLTNFPWCRNDRFTTPIYSLLDVGNGDNKWMPGPPSPRDLLLNLDEAPANLTDPNVFLRISVEQFPNLVYDFSALRISTGAVRLPVLKPIQVRLDQPYLSPPGFYMSPNDTRISEQMRRLLALPDLPPIPSIFADVLIGNLPSGVTQTNMPDDLRIEIPTTPDEIRQILDLLQNFSMKEPYEKFWDSITQDRENWDCENVDTLPCIHVEMDLLERFTRIGARPAIQLKEDIASRGVWRGALLKDTSLYERIPSMQNSDVSDLVFPPCPREDWVCQLLNPEKTHPRSGWRIEGADPQAHMDALNALRERMIDETIPKNNEGAFPYIVRPNDMLPSFEIPPPLTLTPLLISPAQ